MENNLTTPDYRILITGVDTKVPLKDGSFVTAVNFDNAASTPPLVSVMQRINEFGPWYSSVHRGTGYKSRLSSDLYEKARQVVAEYVNADLKDSTVIFVNNTTEAINKLSYRLLTEVRKGVVLSTQMEHHSNDLPWRDKYRTDYITVDKEGRLCLEDLKAKLDKYKKEVRLVTVTGASNVTGYCNPIHDIAALAHKYGARILVDGAQLAPHVPIDMNPGNPIERIDFLAFSAHKMYAPFGTGVLIGPTETFAQGVPEYVGGGTIDVVTPQKVTWAPPPHKDEAGSPNVMGVIALVEAISSLKRIGMKTIEKNEKALMGYTLDKLTKIRGLQFYSDTKNCQDRIGILPFNISGLPHHTVAEALSQEAGIAVRSGSFCAQPYVRKLLGITDLNNDKGAKILPRPGMVRISLGLYNTEHEIDRLAMILEKIADNKKKYLQEYQEPVTAYTSYC